MAKPQRKAQRKKPGAPKGEPALQRQSKALPTAIANIINSPQKHAGGRPSRYTPEIGLTVEAIMRKGLSLTAAAGALGFARQTFHNWMVRHPEFLDAVNRGKAGRVYKLESDMLDTESGAVVNARRFALVNAAPEEWREKREVETKTAGDDPFLMFLKSIDGNVMRPVDNPPAVDPLGTKTTG